MIHYIFVAAEILAIEMCFVGALTGVFYIYDKCTSGK